MGLNPKPFAPEVGGGGVEMKLLWRNASPTSDFSAQTLTLDLSEYDAAIVSYAQSRNDGRISSSILCMKDRSISIGAYRGASIKRTCEVMETGVKFGDASSSSGNTNSSIVPYEIFGVKGVESV